MRAQWWTALEYQATLLRLWQDPQGKGRDFKGMLFDPEDRQMEADQPPRKPWVPFMGGLLGPRQGTETPHLSRMDFKADPERWEPLAGSHFGMLLRAVPFWVARPMCELIEAAAPTMPQEPLKPTDLPERQGFAVFESPLVLMLGDKPRAFTAVCWGFVDQERGAGVGMDWYERFGYERWFVEEDLPWPNGSSPNEYWGSELYDYGTENLAVFDGLRLLLKAFWTLAGQKIAVREPMRELPRFVRRRYDRVKLASREVSLVTLRRLKTPGHEEEHPGSVDWSHRWIVGGHWRNQFLPSVNDHRLQWISPYVKGPEDRPLVVKQRLYRWTR